MQPPIYTQKRASLLRTNAFQIQSFSSEKIPNRLDNGKQNVTS